MKIQCNVCEVAEATVLCCADEAALCWSCDQHVHAANKLATKHQRVPLCSSSTQMPKCDICQEALGYFFCLQDRALLCRKCDFSVHTRNPIVYAHHRFLLTGVKVGLEAAEHLPSPPSGQLPSSSSGQLPSSSSGKLPSSSSGKLPSSSSGKMPSSSSLKMQLTPSNDNLSIQEASPLLENIIPVDITGEYNTNLPVQPISVDEDFESSMLPYTGGSAAGSISPWPQIEDFLELGDYNQTYNFMDHGSSKADSGKLGDSSDFSNFSPLLGVADGELGDEECMGQVPDPFWSVPEIPSPPTASGLHWSRKSLNPFDQTSFVPNVGSPLLSNSQYPPSRARGSKRRRRY